MTLPTQPASGAVRRVPLGGDGYSNPFAAYSVVAAAVTGDATGGIATIRIFMDPDYTSLVAYMTATVNQASVGDADMRLIVAGTGQVVPTAAFSGNVEAVAATVSSTSITKTWTPPAIILPGSTAPEAQIAMTMTNVDTDVYTLTALIYLFDIRVRELTPISFLVNARGASGQGF